MFSSGILLYSAIKSAEETANQYKTRRWSHVETMAQTAHLSNIFVFNTVESTQEEYDKIARNTIYQNCRPIGIPMTDINN